ncbi:hypothetical protein [Cetobacterium sp.]|uniref:hypothetical protein n=1 Tax=Cetobacterium sp. TaxID=2071632 RepID=UPI003F2A3063
MGNALKIFGAIWGVLGVGNIIMTTGGETMMLISLIFNFLVFIFPGLILYVLGDRYSK